VIKGQLTWRVCDDEGGDFKQMYVCVSLCLSRHTKRAATKHRLWKAGYVIRVGLNHILWCIYTVFFAGKSPNIRSYMVYIYGSGQLYI
jgi:hypothetical protein